MRVLLLVLACVASIGEEAHWHDTALCFTGS
jgi:hypothetical protein